MRRLRDAASLLIAAANAYHALVLATRYAEARRAVRTWPVPDINALVREFVDGAA